MAPKIQYYDTDDTCGVKRVNLITEPMGNVILKNAEKRLMCFFVSKKGENHYAS